MASKVYQLPDKKLYYETPTGYAYIKNPTELNKLRKQGVLDESNHYKVNELPIKSSSNTGADSDYYSKLPVGEALQVALQNYQGANQGQYGLEGALREAITKRTQPGYVKETNALAKGFQGIEDPLLRSGLMRQSQQARSARVENVIADATSLYQQKIEEAKNQYDMQVQRYNMEQDVIKNAFSEAILQGGTAPEGLPDEYRQAWQDASNELKRQIAVSERPKGGTGNGSIPAADKSSMYNNALQKFLSGTTMESEDGTRVFTADDFVSFLNEAGIGDYIDNFRSDMKGLKAIPDATNPGGFQFYMDLSPITREEFTSESGYRETDDIYKKYFPE